MRICLYTCSALPKMGGQEFVVDSLARRFLAMGHEPTVLAPVPQIPYKTHDASLPYRMIRHPRFVSTHRLVSWYRTFLAKAHRTFNFDVVHCHDVHPSAYIAALLKPKMRWPLVITSHGGDVKENNVRLRKPGAEKRFVLALKSADAIVSIGKFTEESIRRICPDIGRMLYIPNGVDFQAMQPRVARPQDIEPHVREGQYILFLGRLKSRKGVDVLLEAIALLPLKTRMQFILAGSGEDEAKLKSHAAHLGLNDRVKFVGRIGGDTKTWFLQNAFCVVIPSRDWEAFPLVVLESYAAGKAVVASAIPGLRDLVNAGQTGLLVPQENPEALSQSLAQMINNPIETQRMGATAQASAHDFDWDVVARKHIELYESLV